MNSMKTTYILNAFAALSVSLFAPALAQEAPTMAKLSTGSEVATWTMAADKPTHITPVVFVHGGPGMYTTPRAMTNGAALRTAGFTTIYYDQAGGGKSPHLSAVNYTVERAVLDLEALRVSLKQEKLVLWGSSWGASLVTLYAVRYPEHVAGLILTSPGSYPGTHAKHDYKPTNRGKVKLSKELSAAASKIDRGGAAAESSLSQDDTGRALDVLVNADLMGGMVCKGSTITAPPPGAGANLFANRMIAKDLDKMSFKPATNVRVPTLIVRGECDFLSADNAEAFAKLLGGTVTTLAGTGHGLVERRAEVNAALSSFAGGALASVP
jgi:pimeloyl-ACP methyl ester carboxylesterase